MNFRVRLAGPSVMQSAIRLLRFINVTGYRGIEMPDELDDMFPDTQGDHWVLEWRKIMCRKMFNHDSGEYCLRPVEVFPCAQCRYWTKERQA